MRSVKSKKKKRHDSRTPLEASSRWEKIAEPAPLGAEIPGFAEDWQFYRYENAGVGFKTLSDVIDTPVTDASGSRSPGFDSGRADEGRAASAQEEAEEARDPLDTDEAPVGASEWSIRAQHFLEEREIDAPDSARSDEKILLDILKIVERGSFRVESLQCDVRGGEVTLRGTFQEAQKRDFFEKVVEAVPGVKELHSFLS